jgi:hypothetical protein
MSVPDSHAAINLGGCPNLRWWFRGVYRLGHDPAAETGDHDPWMATLPGRHGVVFPFAEGRLCVEVFDPRVANRIAAALDSARPYQRGERFWSFVFDVAPLGKNRQRH